MSTPSTGLRVFAKRVKPEQRKGRYGSGGGAVTPVYFIWDADTNATSYVLQIGTSTGASDRFNEDVGNVLTYGVSLETGSYYSRVQPWANSSALSTSAEQTVTI